MTSSITASFTLLGNFLNQKYGIQFSSSQLFTFANEVSIDLINQTKTDEIFKNLFKTIFRISSVQQKAKIYALIKKEKSIYEHLSSNVSNLDSKILKLQKVAENQKFHFGTENVNLVVEEMMASLTDIIKN